MMSKTTKILMGIIALFGVLGVWLIRSPFQMSHILPAPTPTNATMLETGTDQSGVSATDVVYYKDIKGYYVTPKGTGPYPGVILIHEWWGLTDGIKDAARTLSAHGYRVLAVDLFHESVTEDTKKAQELVASVDSDEAIKNMQAALLFLKDKGATKIASWGWCFGGGQSMQLALSDIDLNATVIYYGNLEVDETKLSNIKWPVLGVFGDKDTTIPVSTVKTFDGKLTSLQIPHEIEIYQGVGHAFANPTGRSYAPKETKDAWDKTIHFLDKYLKS